MDTLIIAVVGCLLALAAVVPFIVRQHRRERASDAARAYAVEYGLDEPHTLHPVVDAAQCIGTANCVKACPEKDVLGLRSGQAVPVSPARCVGHGMCERSCPMDAIQLFFGTEKRGVDLPRVKGNFETNVPGLYVVGELGGMGLIRNAFLQGKQCIEGIARLHEEAPPGVLQVVIVGCGPAGLSASLTCQLAGLTFETIEKEDVGGTVRHYPRRKLIMTNPLEIPGYGTLSAREIRKEELMEIWADVVEKTGLEVRTGEPVSDVQRLESGIFEVTTARRTVRALRVVLAIGRRGVPRKLGIPGEETPKVAYSLRNADAYRGRRVLVVGGGDAAIETALALSEEPGTDVSLSYRKDRFSRIKPNNLDRIEAASRSGAIEILWNTNLSSIASDAVSIEAQDGSRLDVPNDHVFIQIGGELPIPFLRRCGIIIETKFGEPVAGGY